MNEDRTLSKYSITKAGILVYVATNYLYEITAVNQYTLLFYHCKPIPKR